jgi:hypothetical protein
MHTCQNQLANDAHGHARASDTQSLRPPHARMHAHGRQRHHALQGG